MNNNICVGDHRLDAITLIVMLCNVVQYLCNNSACVNTANFVLLIQQDAVF